VAPSNADQQAVDEATDLCMRVCAFRGGVKKHANQNACMHTRFAGLLLGMLLASKSAPHACLWVVSMDSRNDLWDDHQPCVNADKAKALLQRGLHIWRTAPGKPEGQQPQDILQIAGAVSSSLAQRNAAVWCGGGINGGGAR
jgi:hypothetical protein